MLIDVKVDELKPNTILFYDGKKIVSITDEQLLGVIKRDLKKVMEFQDSLSKRQENYELKLSERYKKFLNIFRGGKK